MGGRGGQSGVSNRGGAIKSAAEAKDYEQLRQYMESTHDVKITDGVAQNIPFELTRRCCEDLEYAQGEYGATLRGITIGKLNGYPTAYAGANMATNELLMNFDKMNDIGAMRGDYSSDVLHGYHPSHTTYLQVMMHEIGHLMVAELARRRGEYHLRTAESIVKRAADRAVAWRGREATNSDMARFISSISGYAKTDADETIAEAVSDYRANGVTASTLSGHIVDILREEFAAL